jgi:ERF superfamily
VSRPLPLPGVAMSGVHEAMAKTMVAVSSIKKTSSSGVNYKFRSVEDVMNALHGPLSANGLFLSVKVLDDWQLNPIPGAPDNKGNPRTQFQASFRVQLEVWHKSGEMVTLGPGLAQSHDYGDKAVYQAQQNAIKYLLLTAFAIPTEEQDMDARVPDDAVSPPDQDWKKWVWEESAVLKDWTEDERKAAAKAAMDRVLGSAETIANSGEAMIVLNEMRVAYENRTDGLPLDV